MMFDTDTYLVVLCLLELCVCREVDKGQCVLDGEGRDHLSNISAF